MGFNKTQWDFNGMSMGFQWDFNGMSMGFQWDLYNGIYVSGYPRVISHSYGK